MFLQEGVTHYHFTVQQFRSLNSIIYPLNLFFSDTPSGSDFKLDAFLVAPCETFEPHYGIFMFVYVMSCMPPAFSALKILFKPVIQIVFYIGVHVLKSVF